LARTPMLAFGFAWIASLVVYIGFQLRIRVSNWCLRQRRRQ
jgi:hypothetical protein